MVIKRLDFKTRAEESYYEHVATRGSDAKMIRDMECLWQEFVGELKTNKGELVGVGTGDYGSNLKRILGDNVDLDIHMEIDNCIAKTAESYPEIYSCHTSSQVNEQGKVSISIELGTIYGRILRVYETTRGC